MTNQFSGGQTQKDVEFLLQGSNQDEIKKFGKQLLEKLQNYDGMVDISSTLDPGIIELRLNIDRDKIASYGISPTVIAQTVSYYMLGGDKANTATLKTDSEEIDVLVRLPKEKRNDINTLSSLKY